MRGRSETNGNKTQAEVAQYASSNHQMQEDLAFYKEFMTVCKKKKQRKNRKEGKKQTILKKSILQLRLKVLPWKKKAEKTLSTTSKRSRMIFCELDVNSV